MKKSDGSAAALILGAICLCVYFLTLAPTVCWFDSGELITSAVTLTVSHPPGASLFNLLAKLFSYLPFGTVAFRINLFCAVLGALTIAVLYLFFSEVGPIPAALAGCLTFAFSRQFWNQATFTDIYTLHLLLVSLLFLSLARWESGRGPRWFYTASFTLGLLLTLRTPILIYVPSVLILMWPFRKKLKGVSWVKAGLSFLTGFCFYLYVPLRMYAAPDLNSGSLHNMKEALLYFTAAGYKRWLFNLPLKALAEQAWFFGNGLTRQFTLVGVGLGLWGMTVLFRKRKKYWFWLAAIFLIDALFYMQVYPSQNRVEHFYFVSFLVFSLWIGLGLWDLGSRLRPFVPIAGVGLCVAFPLCLLVLNWPKVDKHDFYQARDYARNVFSVCGPDALLVTDFDNEYHALKYLKYVEGQRPDIELIHTGLFEMQRHIPWETELSKAGGRPVYFTYYADWLVGEGYQFVPCGPVWQLEGKSRIQESSAGLPRGGRIQADKNSKLAGLLTRDVDWRPGQTSQVELFWRRPTKDDLPFACVFVLTDSQGHWLDEKGEPYFIHIHSPLYDRYPVGLWKQGRFYKEKFGWVARWDLKPGAYELWEGEQPSQELLDRLETASPDVPAFDNYDKDNPEMLKYNFSQGGWERGHTPDQIKAGVGDWVQSSLAANSLTKVRTINVSKGEKD